jgi:lysophospholipase L1-like esterase
MNGSRSCARLWLVSLYALLLASNFGNAQVKVGCIGNSITDFSGYTDTLQTLLGSGYQVQNDGVSGRTLMRNGDYPYWTQGKLTQLFAFQPNIITIKLGTNDTKSWNWVYKDQFVPDYNAFIDTLYQSVQPKPRIFMIIPVPIFPNNMGIDEAVRSNEMTPKLKQIAAQRGLPLIDCFTPLQGRSDLFPDGVHPNAAGADSVANIIYRGMMTTAMIAYPSALNFTVSIGENGSIEPKIVAISNAAIVGNLDVVQISHQSNWLLCVLSSSSRNNQVITNSINTSDLPNTADTLFDTVTVSAGNAKPSAIKYVVSLITRAAPVFSKLAIDPDTVLISTSQSVTFSALALNQYDEIIPEQTEVTWSAPGATISSSGEFSAPGPGQYDVLASSGAVSAKTLVIVSNDFTPLPTGVVTSMLQLQDQSSSPYIPIGSSSFDTDFTGNELSLVPVEDQSAQVNSVNCTWTRATVTNGLWCTDNTKSVFISYSALYLYSPKARNVALAFKHDDDFQVMLNGSVAVKDPGWMSSTGPEKISQPIELSRGVNRFIFKFRGGLGPNLFSVRFIDPSGAELEGVFEQFSPDSITLPPVRISGGHRPTMNHSTTATIRYLKPGVIGISIPSAGRHDISVTTPAGRTVCARTVEGAGEYLLQDHNLSFGIYVVRVKSQGVRETVKKIVNFTFR